MSKAQTLLRYYGAMSSYLRRIANGISCSTGTLPFSVHQIFVVAALIAPGFMMAQNPMDGLQGFQVVSEGNFTVNGGPHIHGPLGIGGNFVLNTSNIAEINMDNVGTYIFPGDGTKTTGVLVKGGITWTNGMARILNSKVIHIGSSTGSTQSDNGTNQSTQVLPSSTSYNNAKRIETTIDQTPSPAVFQTGGLDISALFTDLRTASEGMAACSNNVQLYNSNNLAIAGNNVTTSMSVQINSLATGVNYLDLTQSSLSKITEFKFNNGAAPSATKLLVISVPLTSNFTWNNPNMPGASGSSNGAYTIWNFSGTTSYNLTISSSSLVIGSIFAPNHNFYKTGSGDIDGNLVAKTITIGTGEVHYFPFSGNVPLCGVCSNYTSAGTIGANQTGSDNGSFDPVALTETAAPTGGTGSAEYQWQVSTDNSTWTDISGATGQSYDPPAIAATTYYRRGVRRSGCTTYIYSASVTMTTVADVTITAQPSGGIVTSGDPFSLSVSATCGIPNITYQWQRSTDNTTFTNISGATSSTYTTPPLTASAAYRVQVGASGNGFSTITSNTAQVGVGSSSSLGCGNFLGNPEFNYGTNRWSLSTSSGNSATWSVNTSNQLSGANCALVNITAATGGSSNAKKIQFSQTGYVVYAGTTYTVSFQAKAASNRNINVSLQQVASPYTTYANQTVALTTTKTTYTLTFPVTTTDLNGAGLYFNLGESTANVYLDNVVFSEQCGSQLCANGTGHNIISNSEMDNGQSNWNLSVQGGATATVSTVSTSQLSGTNSSFINIGTATGTNWHVQYYQAGHTVQAGKTYRVTFKAKATSSRNMYVSLQQNYSPWSEIDGKTVSLTTSAKTFTIDFTANQTDENDVGLFFHLGESNADVYLDDVEWAELCNTEICNNGYDDDGDGLIDAADSDCNNCDAPTYGFQNGTLISGTALSPGAVYLFQNVTPGTDVRVKINSFSHSDVKISNIDLSAYDAPGGYNLAFQPQVLYGWKNSNGTFDSPGERYVSFTFNFYDAGTTNPQEVNKLVLSAIDVDGDNSSLVEFIETSGFSSYETNSPTALTLSGSLKAKSNISNATNIDETALDHMISYTFNNKTSFTVKYGAEWTGASNSFADDRLNSLFFKCYALNTQVACPTVSVSGQYSICTGTSQTLTSTTSGGSGTKTYQWQSSLDNETWTNITGATSASYTTPALTAKTYFRLAVTFSGNPTCGAIYSDDFPVTPGLCLENCTNGIDDNGNGLVDGADLDCATLCATGSASFERWLNISGAAISDLTGNANYPNSPTETGTLTSLDGPDNIADDYGTRVRGYITPSVTGNYVFNLTSDDAGQFFLSSNADPASKTMVASVTGWTNPTEYNKYSSQTSSPYYLQAGRNYYFEILQKEGGGLDHFQVYWKTPSNTNWTIVPGSNLRPYFCAEICGNGLDDDGNGLADCADAVCQPTITYHPAGATICSGGTHIMSVAVNGSATYQWQSSTNNTTFTNISGATSASYTTPALTSTTYYRVIVTVSGCPKTSNAATVTVLADPTIVTQPASTTICAGLSTTLSVVATGGTPSLTYQWQSSLTGTTLWTNISGATSSTYTTPALSLTGYYRVIVIASGNGCGSVTSNVATVSLGVGLAPVITGNTTICTGSSTILTAAGAGTFAWSTGGTSANLSVAPTVTTTYTVTLTNATGCTGSAQATVVVNAKPTANAGADVTVCAGTSTTLTASGGSSYAWSNGLGTGSSKSVSPTTTSTYTVTVTNAEGCTATDAVVVNVNPTPVANAGSDITICKNSSTTLTASATGGVAPYSFAWSNSLGSNTNVTVTPASTTAYTVTVTGANGCTSSAAVTVTVNAVPTASAGAPVTICTVGATTLTATGAGAPGPFTYYWSNGNVLPVQVVSPGATTTYTVTVTSSNGCFSTGQVTVTVQPCVENCGNGLDDDGDGYTDCADSDCGPVADAGSDMSVCPGTPAFLNVGVTGGTMPYTYFWSNGLGGGATKMVTPTVTTTYSVTVTSATGCTSVDQVKVTVLGCTEDCTNGLDDDGDGLVDCDDPSCAGVTAPLLADDHYTTCPGIPYSNRVTYNDGNLNNPLISIVTEPTHGTVTIDWTGKFVYTPSSFECLIDQFTYQICNQSSGCCATAVAYITMGDNTQPTLINVPADLTISCDDAVPSPPLVTGFDQCPGIYLDYAENSTHGLGGACGSYTITRTWTATDFCGNSVSDDQVISVVDQTKPELFRLYTLEGGANLVAGFAQRVTHDWKYVRFPITFKAPPVVLASISTSNDPTAVVTQVRNVSMQGFELRLREEEVADGSHGIENVSWIAVDADSHSGNLKWEAGTLANVNETPSPLGFTQVFGQAPLFFSSSLTTLQNDPATLRHSNLSATGVEVFAQEEQSLDTEVARTNETIGYLAMNPGAPVLDKDGEEFGETGKVNLTNAWATVNFDKKYTKPVLIVGGLSNNDHQAVTIRVRNLTSTKCELRLQEWNYLDGSHPSEAVSWMVVEGSVPGNASFYCTGKANNLKPNVNLFAVDNCDNLVNLAYTAASARIADGLVQNHTWTVLDDCGNTTLVSRIDTCQVVALKLKALIYGPLQGNTGPNLTTMRDNLREQAILPIIEPYSTLPAFPYVKYQIHETGGNSGNGGTGLPNIVMVDICHQKTDGDWETKSINVAELPYYISIGDKIGECGAEHEKITICHMPGTENQKTLVVSADAILAHLAHGDKIGSCEGAGDEVPVGATAAQFQTIADGLWNDAATWLGGNIPPDGTVSGKTINIQHKVRLTNSGLKLKSGTKLYVTGGSLAMDGNNLEVQDASLLMERSVLDMAKANTLKITNASGVAKFKDCTVNIGKDLLNNGGNLTLDHVELKVDGKHENSLGTDSLINVCAIFDGNVLNKLLSNMYVYNSNIKLHEGSFTNLGSVTGGNIRLLIEEGSLLNTGGLWSAPLLQYCISGSLGLTGAILPGIEDCNNISNVFSSCNCYEDCENESIVGSGNTGIVSNIVETINPGKSFGDGELDDPAVLNTTGSKAIVDWVLVELRSLNNEAEVLGYQSVMLERDGSIVGENGDSLLIFPGLEEGDYYVTIRHRNHLGLTTNTPIFLSIVDPPLIDFSDLNTPVKGGSNAGKLNGGKRTLWGGDMNGDGKVIYQGPNNDVFRLFSKVISYPENTANLANYIVPGYETADFNMDGKAVYQGPNNDRSHLLLYTILSHPGNFALLANYIALDAIP